MNKRILFGLVIALLAFGFVVSLPRYLPTARAVTGLVCLGDPNSAAASGTTPCPASAPTFSAPVGGQLRVAVFIQGSDALNGFGITLKADHTKIAPIGVDLTGTVLPGTPTPIVECLSNILKAGGACPSTDTIDTLDYFVTGGFGLSTNPPTSGILFTAIYNVTGTGSTTIGYQTGCGSASSPTSVPPNTCVTISSGATQSLSETAQTANFNNAALPPNLSLSASPTSLIPPASSTSTITVTGHNGWPPSGVTDSVAFTVTAPPHVTASVNPPSCTPSIPCTTTLSVSGTGTGPVQVVGTYQTIVSSETETLSAQATVNVGQPAALTGVTVSPTTVAGASGSATAMVSVTGSNGFTGPVALSLGTTLPTGLTASFNPSSVTLSGTGITTGTSTVTFSGAANSYNTQIKATAGTASKTSSVVHVTLTQATGGDFSLSASPLTVSGATNTAAVSTITVAPTGTGFTSDVALTVVAAPSTGVTCTLTPTTVTAATGTSLLSCTATSSGSFTATVTGTGGGKTHNQPVTFNIAQTVPKDFALSAAPATVPVTAGSSGTSTITVTASGGLTGTITLTNSTTPSTGLTCNLSPKTVTLGTSGTSTLTCNAASTANGMFTTVVTGSNGTVTRMTSVVFNVTPVAQPGFSLSASPTSVTCNAGDVKTVTINVMSQGSFNGVVMLAPTIDLATGLTATINPTSVTGSGSATLTLTCTTAGSYTVTVTGTSGTLSPVMIMIPVTVNNVTTPSFTLTASPSSISCTSTDTTTHTSTISLTAQNGFTGSAALTVSTLPPGLTNPTVNPTSVSPSQTAMLTVNCAGATPGTYTASVHGSSPYVQASVLVTISVSAGQQQGTFSLSSSPLSMTCNTGDTKTSTISVTGTNGFSGTVNLQAVTVPSTGLGAVLSQSSVTGSGSSMLTLTCTTAGSYAVTVTGTSGSMTAQTTTVNVIVNQQSQQGNFSLTAVPSSITVHQGASKTSMITVVPANGFSSEVSLTATAPSGLTAALSPTSVSGAGSSTLTVTASNSVAPGTYAVTVTGTAGSNAGPITHSTTVTVTVPSSIGQGSFTITVSPSSLTVLQGCENVTRITLTSTGFSGTLTLSTKVSPENGGVTADLSKVHVQLGVDQTNHLVLTVSADQDATLGSYTIAVTGASASGSVSQSATVHVTVLSNTCHADNDNEGTGHCGSSDDKSHCGCPSVTGNKGGEEKEHGHEGAGDNNDHGNNECKTSCHPDNESVEGSEHENSHAEKCPASPTHGSDKDEGHDQLKLRNEN